MIKLAVLGSTRGTDMQAIIDAIESQFLSAKIEVVISNKSDAFILQRAKNHDLYSVAIPSKGKSRNDYDIEVMNELSKYEIDIIVLIGYMRIIGSEFVDCYEDKIINVHPSLLPKFAGGMDCDVHQAVIDAGEKITGCTVHYVTAEVDQGKILLQKSCNVEVTDTPESLKVKVQKLEGEALVEVLTNWSS